MLAEMANPFRRVGRPQLRCYTANMRGVRIAVGLVLLVGVSSALLAGVWVLREAGGGGLPFTVSFEDARNLKADDSIIYGDAIVGRVENVDGNVVHARVAAEHANLVQRGSRFWIHSRPAMAILMFDTPTNAGGVIEPGHRFTGLTQRPDPDPQLAPPATPRKLAARPVWLCEVRVTLELAAGADLSETQRRKAAGVVVERLADGTLLVLAPSWVVEYSGDLLSEAHRVELIGGATFAAELVETRVPFAVLAVRDTGYVGALAPLWPDALADAQGLVLTDLEGMAFTVEHRQAAVELRAQIAQGYVALIDGANVAGFAVPVVGRSQGATWIPLNGAGTAIQNAKR